MSANIFWRTWSAQWTTRRRRPVSRSRLEVTPLEDRTTPASFVVSNTNDTTAAGTLRTAIDSVNVSSDPTNTITFSPGLSGTITLTASLPTITQSVAIQGPGAAVITIDGNMAYRIFDVDDGAAAALTVSISGLTLTHASAATGAAVYNDSDAVTLQNLAITRNFAIAPGGKVLGGGVGAGLYTGGGSVNVLNSTFTDNSAADTGAAIANTGSTVTISDSTIDSNTAASKAGTGGYFQSGGSSTIIESSFTNNVGGEGAGLFVTGGPTSLATSYIANNKSTNAGGPDNGGGLTVAGGQVTIQNSTVSGNTANNYGAGVDFESGTLTIQNSTIATNTADADNTGGGDGGGVFVASGLTVDLSSDIIAKNTVGTTGANPDVSGAASTTSAFNLIDDLTGLTGISNGTQNNQIGTADPMFVSTTPVFNGGPTPTFALQATSLAIGAGTANGLTTDQRGAPFVRTAGAGTDIGAFQTQPNQALVVTTAQDLNNPVYDPTNLSLREALRLAGTNAPTITFAPALDGSTIALALGTLDVNRSVSIQGPGASQLAVDGEGMFQPFLIYNGTASTLSTVSISGLTIQNGDSDPSTGGTGGGGAIESAENTTLDGVIVKTSKAAIYGGGIAQAIRGTLTVTNSWVTGNTTTGEGGGIENRGGSTVKIVNTAVTNNTAGTDGGGVASEFATANLVIQNSTVASNNADSDGGGVWVNSGSTFSLDNSTVALNMADADNTGGGDGGGLFVAGLTTPATMQSTIVAKNTVGTSGADLDIDGPINATMSLVFNTTGWGQGGSDAATLRGVDPLLGPLQNNGGLSPTLALQAGSPAIDAGSNPDHQTTDQRGTGFARVTGAGPDIGAFEFGSAVTITITPATLPAGTVGTAYSQALTAAGAAGPFTFAASGTLPAGLTLTPAGVLSGTPTAAGPSTFTVTATAGTVNGSQAYTVTIDPASAGVTLSPATLPAGVVGTAYSQALTAAGAAGPFTFAVTTGTLPAGLTLTPAGVLSGTPTAAGPASFTVTATAGTASGSQAYTLTVNTSSSTVTITPATLPAGAVGTAYSQTLTAAGAAGPFTFAVTTGTLPAGLTLTPAGVLSGTPTAVGPSSFTVTATSGVLSGSQAYTLTVNTSSSAVTITPATLPAGVVGTAYSQTLTAAGAAGPFTFAVTTGTLPAGLTLTPAGVLSGTPTAVGSSSFTVTATASTASGSQAYTLTVAASSTPTQALVGATQFAVGADAGGSGVVTVYNANQSVAFTFTPFPGFTGGVRVAAFQVGSTTYVAAATGPGVTNQVVVYDGTTQAVVDTITPFESTFTGGLFVSAGVIAAGGAPDLIVTPDQSGGPVVVVYDGASLAGGSVNQVARFFGINDPSFRGGDRAAVGDVNGDGVGDVIVSAGFGGGPRIAIYNGTTISAASPTELVPDFFAFESTLRNGAYVTAGDLTGSGYADLIFGAGPGGGPRVRAVNSAALLAAAGSFSTLDDPSVAGAGIADFFAGDPSNRGGIRVTVKNLDGDTKADLVVGDGTGAGSTVTSYTGAAIAASGSSPASGLSFDAFPGFTGGVFVG
ncbi:beta strand repeat-containing protein [Fimbriiglobus ruber]|uniref:Fibronectin type III domain protein n=1 Tax=Fimbriiglobus ruber TaxID=1908690 RepID=A0A225DA86_9BACT|nr:putative Ig domain-containing protein [Fimbriiglobus ruber]OWK36574.1 Fibronectin type III domain protein [Fimbriiglobus ruber]